MKRFISLILSIIMSLSLCIPVMATDEGTNNFELPKDWKSNVESYKITFEKDTALSINEMPNNAISDSMNWDEEQKAITLAHNKRVAEQAKAFVKSLGLSEDGFEDIEELCIEQLESYKERDDAQLISYTVNTPQKSSSPSESDLLYFGTYQNRDFYFFYPSEAEECTNIKKQTTKSILQNWAKALISVLLSYSGGGSETVTATVQWSDILKISSLPKNYVITDNAFSESYCNVVVHTRGIYTQFGNGDYEMLTSQQFGEVYPYVVFHPVDPPEHNAAISYDYGFAGIVTSPRYSLSTNELCKEAWQKFYGALVFPDRLLLSSLNTYWK